MIYIKRAQIGSRKAKEATFAIDITVRAGLLVSPTWKYVMGSKKPAEHPEHISHQQYSDWYLRRLDDSNEAILKWTLALPEDTTLLCYCRDEWFCHTHLLAMWLEKVAPQRFSNETEPPYMAIQCFNEHYLDN